VRRKKRPNSLRWGKTEFSRGPLKSKAAVKRLAARLKAKRAPYAQDAGRYADKYWDSILAQPSEQRKLLDIDRRYPNPRRRNPGKRKLASREAKRLRRYHKLYDREYQSAMGFLPFAGSKLERRHGKIYKPYGKTRITTSDIMHDPDWKGRRGFRLFGNPRRRNPRRKSKRGRRR
jgi:hypothetical protein